MKHSKPRPGAAPPAPYPISNAPAAPVERQRKGDLTRQALMESGFRVFASKGFLRAHIQEIARGAGKSHGVFHIYFRNKDALLDSWLDECDRMVPWYQADISLLFETAHSFVLESFWLLYARFGPVLDALDEAALVSDHFAARRAAIQAKGDDSMARMIRHAQAQGHCCGIDPELTAVSIAALLSRTTAYWFHHRAALEARGIDAAAALANLEVLYTRMLQGQDAHAACQLVLRSAV